MCAIVLAERKEKKEERKVKGYYEANKPTGAIIVGTGNPEIGNRCRHQHRSMAAAEKCARRYGYGWRVERKEGEK